MTTLLADGRQVVVRCNGCRRLWPLVADRVELSGWRHDEVADHHLCSVCTGTPPVVDRDLPPG